MHGTPLSALNSGISRLLDGQVMVSAGLVGRGRLVFGSLGLLVQDHAGAAVQAVQAVPTGLSAHDALQMGAGSWVAAAAIVASTATALVLRFMDRRTETSKAVVEDGTALRKELWEQAEQYRRELGEASDDLHEAKELIVELRTEVGLLTNQCRYLVMLLRQHGVAPDLPSFSGGNTGGGLKS